MQRKTPLVTGEYYHIFNRGVDKRQIFMSQYDIDRFMESLIEFNTTETIGSLYHNTFKKSERSSLGTASTELVQIVAYCLNPNHFHLILHQIAEGGISRFMQKVGGGYTNYFNERYERSGSLFQGTFKSVHIESNEQLLHVSAYVNLNDRVHDSSNWPLTAASSWHEYALGENGIAQKDIILRQFKDINDYKEFAEKTATSIARRRRKEEDTEDGKLDGVFEN